MLKWAISGIPQIPRCEICKMFYTSKIPDLFDFTRDRVAEVRRQGEGPSPKSLDSDEHSLFCGNTKICRDLRAFCKTFGKTSFFWGQKQCTVQVCTSVSWARSALLYIYITYCTELNLQICNYVQKRHICHENSKYAPDENSYGHFCAPVSPSLADQILKVVMQGIPK